MAAPWRAGANENTTIAFSTEVSIEGKTLPAGKYGFFRPLGTVLQIHAYGRTLLRLKKFNEAFAMYKMNYEKNPDDIYTNLGMVKGYAALGNKTDALRFADKVCCW